MKQQFEMIKRDVSPDLEQEKTQKKDLPRRILEPSIDVQQVYYDNNTTDEESVDEIR